MHKFRINVSITDFSLLPLGLEPLFKGMKSAGADGLEIVLGMKSRWSAKKLIQLSEKYDLPINTLHQPPWSGIDIWRDEGFMEFAKKLGIKKVVIHPKAFTALNSPSGQHYLETIARWQDKYSVQAMLENAASDWGIGILDTLYPVTDDVRSLEEIALNADKYGFLINYDTSHGQLTEPHTDTIFQKVFSHLGGLHISSFDNTTEHLPLHMGDFKIKPFIRYLYERNYTGVVTFEIYYPKQIQFREYDFASIKKSIEIVKAISPN